MHVIIMKGKNKKASRDTDICISTCLFVFAFHDNNMHISVSRRVHVIMQDKKKKSQGTELKLNPVSSLA